MSSKGPLNAIIMITVIVVGSFLGYMSIAFIGGYPPFHGTPGQTTTTTVAPTTVIGQVCNPATAQPVTVMMTHYSSDSALLTPTWQRFVSNAQGQLVQVSDSPGQRVDGTASANSNTLYSIGPPDNTYEHLAQVGETGAYPVWYQLNSGNLHTPVSQFGNTVYQISCVPSLANPAAFTWAMTGVLFQAPAGGNSTAAAAGVIAAIQFPAASPTAVPTTATTWNVNLNLGAQYRVAMLPYAECGTQAAPVYNYATGTEYYGCPAGPGQAGLPTVQGYLIVLANQTSISISAPGAQPIKSPAMAAGTLAWSIPVSGSSMPSPAGTSAANPYVAVSVPVQIQTSLVYAGVRHVAIVFWFIDMQQISYIDNYLSTAVPGSWTTVAGTCTTTSGVASATGVAPTTWFGGITPTTGQNAGNPVAYINQYYGILLPY